MVVDDDDDDSGPQSVYVVVCCYGWKDSHRSILQLDTQPSEQEEITEKVIKVSIEKCVVARFHGQGEYISSFDWLFCPPTTTSATPVLYMVPNWDLAPDSDDDISEEDDDIPKPYTPVQGYGFNLSTGQLLSINAPKYSKSCGNVLNHTGCIFLKSNTGRCRYDHPDSDFELYDPDQDEWNALPLFPDINETNPFVGTAVLKDTILYNFLNRKLWAFSLTKRKWYPVHVVDMRCYGFVQEAVVQGNTIYAFTRQCQETVLVLAIDKVEMDGDLSFRCSLLKAISVPGMDKNLFDEDNEDEGICHERRLVHLGKDNFCIVWSCLFGGSDYQPLQVTYLKLKEEGREMSMAVTNIRLYMLKMPKDSQFHLKACFSLPKSETTALQKGTTLEFDLEPFSPEFLASEQEDKNPEGHYIFVKKLPPLSPTYLKRQIKKNLKQFGSIKRGSIKVRENEEGKYYAYVEFESADSKQNAIKASHILIGSSTVDISEEVEEPFSPEYYASQQNEKTDVDHSVFECNSPTTLVPDETNRQIEEVVKQSEPIKRDDDVEPRSVFVLLSYLGGKNPHDYLLQLETHVKSEQGVPTWKMNVKREECEVACFNTLGVHCLFPPPTWSSTPVLYVLPNEKHITERDINQPLHGYEFNLSTGQFVPVKPPMAYKMKGHVVVNPRGHIYFMASPSWYGHTPHPPFECYDRDKKMWRTLQPFPTNGFIGHILATAVWDDTILYNIAGPYDTEENLHQRSIWAYNVTKDKWYLVEVVDDDDCNRCLTISGEAVLLGNTIYALTELSLTAVLALSIEREEIDGDFKYKCSVLKYIEVPDLDRVEFETRNYLRWFRRLVHLGEDKFCLVQSCKIGTSASHQPIQLMSIMLEGKGKNMSMTVTNIQVYQFEIQDNVQFVLELCFSLPNCKITAVKQGKRFCFDLNSVDYLESHSIFVRNLPTNLLPDDTKGRLEKQLKKYGPIIRILVSENRMGKPYALVEFQSMKSRIDAVKASSIKIGDCIAQIEGKSKRKKKRRTPSR